jgi:hypothetical protein
VRHEAAWRALGRNEPAQGMADLRATLVCVVALHVAGYARRGRARGCIKRIELDPEVKEEVGER